MKIYQITPYNPYNRCLNKYSSNVYNKNPYTNDCCTDSCSFKGIPNSIKDSVKKVVGKTVEAVSRIADDIQNQTDYYYNRVFSRTTKSIKPEKIKKAAAPAVKKAAGSILPEPNFSMDYEKVLEQLQNNKNIDAQWIKENKAVLKAGVGFEDEQMPEKYFEIMAAEINRNKNIYIQNVKDLQTEEKAKYIQSIWDEFLDVFPPVKPMNKDKSILGLKALQKFGTRDDLLKLSPEYRLSKDSDIMKEYAILVRRVGNVDDSIKILPYAETNSLKIYSEDTIAEMMKTLKKLMVDDAEPNLWKNFEYAQYVQFEKLSTHKNKDISENAKAIMKRLSDENPWMLE